MLVGLVVVFFTGLWLSTRPSLSARATMTDPENSEAEREEGIEQLSFEPNIPDSRSVETEIASDRKTVKDVKEPRYHTVQNGDTLSGISYQYYGSEHKWQKILDANRNVIQDVKNLRLGVRLIIPE
ncbi:MAG: LysM peptidoglycan-binding domain-containing protein [Phycisphaerae bacterium]|nr:LysM peptidoglycan-binding domain-containing protein [Phycisphaerae bacterium]